MNWRSAAHQLEVHVPLQAFIVMHFLTERMSLSCTGDFSVSMCEGSAPNVVYVLHETFNLNSFAHVDLPNAFVTVYTLTCIH